MRLETPVIGEQTWKVAFASSDQSHVNQHFGMASGFCLFEVTLNSCRLVEVLHPPLLGNHNGRIGERILMLNGCQLLFCVAVGESAKRQLMAVGITAIAVEAGIAIGDLLVKLQNKPAGVTTPALKKNFSPVLAEERFVAMLADGWNES